MPVPFANELRGTAAEPQDDFLEVSVFTLPDLKTIVDEAVNLRFAGPWIGKLFSGPLDLPHPGEHKDPARFAGPIVPEQVPLPGDAS